MNGGISVRNWNATTVIAALGAGLALGIALGILLGGALAPPIQIGTAPYTVEPWFKTYQGFVGATIGAAGTVLGLAVATRNVLRQMRLNLISREEDRIERSLPGLRDARDYLQAIETRLKATEAAKMIGVLETKGITKTEDLEERIKKELPRADPRTQQIVVNALWDLVARVARLAGAWALLNENAGRSVRTFDSENRAREAGREVEAAKTGLDSLVSGLGTTAAQLTIEIEIFEKRLPGFRAEIERYFGR